jgi:hypothetical protein
LRAGEQLADEMRHQRVLVGWEERATVDFPPTFKVQVEA